MSWQGFSIIFTVNAAFWGVEEGVTQARLGLITAVQHVLVHALSILGVSAPERM